MAAATNTGHKIKELNAFAVIRIYYFNCHRKGTDFAWYANNPDKAGGMPEAGNINAAWVFGNKWRPAE